jgi:hypothetical protein
MIVSLIGRSVCFVGIKQRCSNAIVECTEPYPPVNYTTLVEETDQAVLTFYVPSTVFDRIAVNWTGVNNKSQHADTFFSTPGSDSVNVTLSSLQGGDLYNLSAVVWSGNLSSEVYLNKFVASK